MPDGEFIQLDSSDFWQPAGSEVQAGDLFLEVPLLSREAGPITATDEWDRTRVYLPTVLEPGLLFRVFLDNWWFLPVVTAAGFADTSVFEDLLTRAVNGDVRGWFPVPPLNPSSDALSRPALVYLLRPTIHRPALLEAVEYQRPVTLVDGALERLNQEFSRAIGLP